MPRVNVMDQPNMDNTGQTACHTQIQDAIEEAGPNGIVYFPAGKYLITRPVTAYALDTPREGGVSFQGDGWQSSIIVRLEADYRDGAAIVMNGSAVVNGFPSKAVEGVAWRDISILGAGIWEATPEMDGFVRVHPCGVGLYAEFVLRSSFRNVHVLVEASMDAIYLRTGWSNHYNFISSVELADRLYGELPVSGQAYPAGTRAGPPLLKHIHGGPGSRRGGLNANVFDCLVEGSVCRSHGADLLHIEPQDWIGEPENIPSQGNNLIMGTYEGTRATWVQPDEDDSDRCPPTQNKAVAYYTGYAVVLKGCTLPSLRDFHLEHTAGLYIENCEAPTVEQGAVQNVTLAGTTRALIDQVTVSNLVITESCSFTRLGAIGLEGAVGISNRSTTTVSLGSMRDLNERVGTGAEPVERVRQTARALANPENLISNGDFSRWLGNTPEGWQAPSGTWTSIALNPSPAGGPHALATRSRTCALYTGPGSGDAIVSHPLPAELFGVWIACSAWVFIPGDSALASVELTFRRATTAHGGEIRTGQATAQRNTWVRLESVLWADSTSTLDEVLLHGEGGAGSPRHFYVADVQANVGLTSATHTFIPPANSAETYQLAGRRITYGTAKPTTGTARVGDIVYNAAPASGQPVGWVCTAAPATWKGFGVVLSS
ncbi:MAG TPA: glycosyl hydrolase family 28-related protein [Longimicrobium sp.]|nr:glycosyl hydrolase family 28-related protein [Longimicrobium sp.]